MQPITIEALREIVQTGREAFGVNDLIIAGGAVRDTLNMRPVKDIDMFVSLARHIDGDSEEMSERFARACGNIAACLGVDGSHTFRATPAEYGPLVDFCEIPTTPFGVPLQIILIDDDPVDDVHKYDFGLSQCFVTPNATFKTDAYLSDERHCTITYTPSAQYRAAMLRSKARLGRLRSKYEFYECVGCAALDELPASGALE
ncbi:hypothetical protein [Burkholderia cenocepacia]|uniref:hypothetical protein n=1 Tax=Burkholderia cenocepacia TaxID=95486 RepID=UPI000D0C0FFE|nr:hypothetical protein [Burkholderia cenocepacia]SOT39811.1 hypothetical protein F01_230155 [Burkholderia cenocepacia]